MIASFEPTNREVRHLTVAEYAHRTGVIVTLCGQEFPFNGGFPYSSIPKRAETCKECAATLDETQRIMGS